MCIESYFADIRPSTKPMLNRMSNTELDWKCKNKCMQGFWEMCYILPSYFKYVDKNTNYLYILMSSANLFLKKDKT